MLAVAVGILAAVGAGCSHQAPTVAPVNPGSSADAGTSRAPDAIYYNGRILTVDPADRTVEAIAVTGERITAVGPSAELRRQAGPATREVDLGGRTVVPGFVDAHSHFPMAADTALFVVDLSSPPVGKVTRMSELIDRLKAKAATTPPGEWIVGVGYDDTLLAEKRHPTREDLDAVSTEHPIFLMHVSFHFATTNSRGLELGGISRSTPDPVGGKYRKDARGEPNGVLEELSAYVPVAEKLPGRTNEQIGQLVDRAAADYLKQGVTTANLGFVGAEPTLLGGPAYPAVIANRAAAGQLPIRVIAWPGAGYWKLAESGKAPLPAVDPSRFQLGATKMFADGSIQGYSGYLSSPYHVHPPGHDNGYRGYPSMPSDKLAELVLAQHRAGRQIAIHGNGDAAIDDILDAYEAAQKAYPRPDARHVIVHSQTARPDQLDRMKALGVVPSFFVLHTYYWGDRHRDVFLGPDRAAHISPTRSALDRGLRFTIHTDTPVVPMAPMRLWWSAVNRRSTSGQVIGPDETITPVQALRAMTIDAAWQDRVDGDRGSLETGKLADFVVLSADPLADPTRIDEIEVVETVVGGKPVYEAKR